MDADHDLIQRRAAFEARSKRYVEQGLDSRAAADFVAGVLNPAEGPVLDVGTGKGTLARALAVRGVLVVTVDPDAVEQELAAALSREAGLAGRIHVVTGDAASLPYGDGHFAAAASMLVLHHLPDARPILSEMVRTLRPGGRIVLADFSREGFDLAARIHREEGRVHTESGVTIDDAAMVLAEYGFSVIERITERWHDIALFAARSAPALGRGCVNDQGV
jgi:SAM-dependent methyltransferase